MEINKIPVLPGEEKKIDVNIAKLPSHSPIDITITTYRSTNPGPVLLLTGGMHGDEINGVEIIRRIIERGLHRCSAGSVICIPVINIYGFIHFSRYVPDGKDVNRSFPGNKNGSLASRIAYYLMKDIVPLIDFGIDFHTGGADRTNYPQVRCKLDDERNKTLADAFCAPFTLSSPYRPNSLRRSAAKEGKQIIVYEGGESSRFDEFAINEGINGTVRLMNKMGMTDNYIDPVDETHVIKNSSWVRAGNSGVFLSTVKYGELVQKNQVVGNIFDPFGDFELKVKAPAAGYVIGLNHNPIVHQGDALMHIGVVKR
ncbi:succinylglutamate desuccinylase/aspartoacylase family protein [Mangrovivirga cuniculi]|uniref:Succinylglutamate desuccinylase n=1 Tax=Mangrovivirga cuniculi TaxID=2715131 RepID=A0A4D7K6Y6_9BACT|nr:succinylglutamate desuccinylase/aspartoacylase family protein [Mangrovivirga cuniculi]QCK15148.1 succinylglutamate desuccinylase [Mangrovivirga cuniculi]